MNVSLIIVLIATLVWLAVIGSRVLLALAAAGLIISLGIFVALGKLVGVQSKPLTDDQRLAAKALGASLVETLTICNGGRYGGQRRMLRAIERRGRNAGRSSRAD
jgi:dipeptide/tripeptide permease